MTAEFVNGIAVLASQPAESPLPGLNGKPVYFKQILKLLLANSEEVYGCLHCDYTDKSVSVVRPHLKGCPVRKAIVAAVKAGKMAAPAWLDVAKLAAEAEKKAAGAPKKSIPVRAPSEPPAKAADNTLGSLVERLQQIPKLEARIRQLEASEASWRDEAMALRAYVNPLLTAMDGKPRRSNARVQFN